MYNMVPRCKMRFEVWLIAAPAFFISERIRRASTAKFASWIDTNVKSFFFLIWRYVAQKKKNTWVRKVCTWTLVNFQLICYSHDGKYVCINLCWNNKNRKKILTDKERRHPTCAKFLFFWQSHRPIAHGPTLREMQFPVSTCPCV